MNDTQKLAYITAVAAISFAKVSSMVEQNNSDRLAGRPVTFLPHQIEEVPVALGLSHNDVLNFMKDE